MELFRVDMSIFNESDCEGICAGNRKNAIAIKDYGMDHSIGDGDDPRTFKLNIPAIMSAKVSGGIPHPFVANNGNSNLISSDVFKLYRDTRNVDGMGL